MAKHNKKKKQVSDKVRAKKKEVEKKINPFEVKINRQKHHVLGKKSKSDKGMPGVSRSKAIKKVKNNNCINLFFWTILLFGNIAKGINHSFSNFFIADICALQKWK